MRVNFEYDMHLQYENRALKARIRELESGAAYVRMQEECEKRCREMEREVRKLKTELENAVRQLRQNREHWFQVYGDMEKEHKKVVERKQGEIRRLQKLCEKTAIAYEQMHEKYLEQLHLRYAAESALEEEKGKNQKLRAQLNRDHENSSIPSSKSLRPKKVANSREKTGRKPGAQPGHKGHCRKKQEPTVPTVFLPPPEAVLEDPDFKKTAKTIIKQLVSIRMVLDVTEYHADVYYNAKTGERVHAAFPDGKALYFARAKKGHEGVKGAVAEDYQGILVHDHDITFYSYGTDHQECLAHVLRYLKDSMDNEPGRAWNKEMHGLIQEMIHFRNETLLSCNLDPEKISGFEERYLKILETARKEYEDIPANAYYKDGYNLFLRMEKYMQNHLLFLHDLRVLATNNEAERLLRNYKRKQAQAVTFRSFESIDYLCQCMSMLVLMRLEDPANIYDRVSRIFG